ncbi:phage tail protein [Mesorhizobium sp. CAU 1732]|uniref:phage tail protein n=1 Tax=Mesorhizobium sp. CAU 1732 TaxID=3140358 RepID=UPI003261A7FE
MSAHMEHWTPGSPYFAAAENPVSPVYGGRMVSPSRLTLWAWDARPFPAYPARHDLWRDSGNWHRGHWLNGRLSSATVGDLIAAILRDHGLEDFDTRFVGGSVSGYVIGAPTTARAALEPLAGLCGISVRDDAGRLTFRDEATALGGTVEIDDIVVEDAIATLEKTRAPDGDLPREAELAYADPFLDYQSAVARIALPRANTGRTHRLVFPGYLEEGAALALLDDWVQRMWAGRDGVSFSVPATAIDITPGARISLPEGGQAVDYQVTNVDIGLSRRVSARRVLTGVPKPWRLGASPAVPGAPVIAGMPHALLLDLPAMPGSGVAEDQFRLAAYAKPWRSQAVYVSAEEEGFMLAGTASRQATLGHLAEAIEGGPEGRVDKAGSVVVELYGGSLSSVSEMQFMNGANAAAIRSGDGGWEVLQFADAEEVAPSRWRLTTLLRGQCGTADAAMTGAAAGAPFVLLNEAVARAGLRPEQAGLLLNWRIGPVGHEFGGETFAALQAIGGVRARLPLSPVHLRVARRAGGDSAISWIRRGRIDADSWLADDIPLGEESERYRVEVAAAGGAVVKTVEVAVPGWVYPRAEMVADLPPGTTQLDITVRQISATIGAGLSVRGRLPITLPE